MHRPEHKSPYARRKKQPERSSDARRLRRLQVDEPEPEQSVSQYRQEWLARQARARQKRSEEPRA